MKNINTKSYWDNRFKSGSWDKAGSNQTIQYALGNVKHLDLNQNFQGKILDFGCALGDAIPVFKEAYPEAQITGLDISEEAISICKSKFGNLAEFICGTHENVAKQYDIIIASHVMEHITNDLLVVEKLLKQCKIMYIIVPYMESPLFHEHVNYYEDDYYDTFEVMDKVKYNVSYPVKLNYISVIKSFVKLKPAFKTQFSKNMILFKLKGKIE